MNYSWNKVVQETKNAGGRIYCAPFGEYQNERFMLKELCFDELHQEHFFTLKQCKELDLDEDYFVIQNLINVYKSGDNVPPVILNQELSVIDGSHRISAMYELGYDSFLAYVMTKNN